jgi:hypothetical protein
MGVVDFDPDAWRRSDEAAGEGGSPAKAAKVAKAGPAEAVEPGALAGLATLAAASLPQMVVRGLGRLRELPTPRLVDPSVWPQVVADAVRLAHDGTAADALAHGWSPLHLWGASPEPGGNVLQEGLAVALCGRRALIYSTYAIMESAAATHSVFTCRPMTGAVFLWELGMRK